MKELFENNELVDKFGKNAKNFAKELTKEKYYEEVYSIYKKLIGGKK